MFAYGVSNSGKSYTISGGSDHEPSERGVLPRSIDVVFNSIQGMDVKANVRGSEPSKGFSLIHSSDALGWQMSRLSSRRSSPSCLTISPRHPRRVLKRVSYDLRDA